MKQAFRSVLVITVFSFGGQLILFLVQVVSAHYFGATQEMDAFLAATALPQYVISVLVGSFGFVFIPFFIDAKSTGGEQMAYKLAGSLLTFSVLVLGVIAVICMMFAGPLVSFTTPGLSEHALAIGASVAIITWPAIVATGAVNLLTGIYQAEGRFGWPAAVPFIGALLNLVLLLILGRLLGVVGLAIATTIGIVVQLLLLMNIVTSRGLQNLRLDWKANELAKILRLALPLILIAVVTKFTPVIDRYIASDLVDGSISRLNYAFKIVTIGSVLLSAGAAAVVFPKMASAVSNNNHPLLGKTMSMGLRLMWFLVAPVIAIGIPLALPVVIALFGRGEFSMADSETVAQLLQIYLIALAPMCLGNLTGKVFYALKDTRTLAIFGTIEAFAYPAYTLYLTWSLGVSGIAIGFVVYYSVSTLWQVLVLRFKLQEARQPVALGASIKILIAAIAGGLASYIAVRYVELPVLQVIVGGVAGLTIYTGALLLFRSEEIDLVRENVFASYFKKKSTPSE